ncbi:MAG: PDZ domain-containing protein [Candidatus Sulfotelmatobacter sp.]
MNSSIRRVFTGFVPFMLLSVVLAQLDKSKDWTEKPLTPDTAETFFEATLHGQKHIAITGVIADTKYKDVNLGNHCTSSSSGSVHGTVDDSGNVTGRTTTSGSTNCSETHNYFYWMDVAYADAANSSYVITARCDVRWVWNHCAVPIEGNTNGMVIEREKKGKYAIYISLHRGALDRKGSVSRYEVVDLKHFERAIGASPVPHPGVAPATETNVEPRYYDHGTDENSFGLVAHVKATEQRGSQCVSTVDIGNSEVEVYNFEHPDSCLGFTNLSAGMNFKARFSLICEGSFDACTTANVDGALAGILVYLPPVVPGADAVIQEYKIVGTREIPNALLAQQNVHAAEETAKEQSVRDAAPQLTPQGTIGISCDGDPLVRHDGVAVSQVVTGGPADRAGIKAEDIILAIDDHYLFTIEELNNALARCKPGSTIRLRYRRYASINETQLIVGSREAIELHR